MTDNERPNNSPERAKAFGSFLHYNRKQQNTDTMKTIKHNISEKEYQNATFAIIIADASHYLILEDSRDFYLGEDWDSLEQTEEDFQAGEMSFKKDLASITDATGVQGEHEAYTISVKDADFGIDRKAFNNGKIYWI